MSALTNGSRGEPCFLRIPLLAWTVCLALALPGAAGAVSIQSGDIIVADPGAGQIIKIDPVTGAKNNVIAAIAKSVTTRSNVFAVWTTIGFFEVQASDGVSPAQTLTSGGLLGDPVDITRATRHRAFYILDRTQLAPIKVQFDSPTQSTYPLLPFMIDPSGIAFDETSEDVFIADSGGAAVHRFDPVAGLVVDTYAAGLVAPTDVDVTPSGEVFAVDGGNLVRVDTSGGPALLIAPGNWTRVAVENDGLSAILLDPTAESLDRVELATGSVTATFSGSPLSAPVDVTIVPESDPVPVLAPLGTLLLIGVLAFVSGMALRRWGRV